MFRQVQDYRRNHPSRILGEGTVRIGNIAKRVDLTTLRLFVAVCEEGNLTRAATRESIAQSAVSKRLNELEELCCVTFFERTPSGMVLTPAGELLFHHARITLLNVEKIAVELTEYSQGMRGHIRMLANLSSIVEFLPQDLPGFFRAHPALRFDLEERPSTEVVRGVEQEAAEIGICSADVETRSLQRFHYRNDRLILVVPENHPLDNNEAVDFSDTLEFDHVGLFATSSIYLRSLNTAQQTGKNLKLRVNVPSFDAACRMVQAGMGIGLIPDRAFAVLAKEMELVGVPLRDSWADRELILVLRDEDGLSASSRLMFEHLRRAPL